ncbi:hypothetical protein [Armatimonas sp.]|uniref:hypothetical protein n=1 Tax=Armatimonas sp. TaxID=1872638 RepID=UPI00286C4D45|nr:hypothetical protein [Armatimonas sp.]
MTRPTQLEVEQKLVEQLSKPTRISSQRRAQQRALFEAQLTREEKLRQSALAYLESSGVSVQTNDSQNSKSPRRAPLYVTIKVAVDRTIIEGKPDWGHLSYELILEQDCYASPQATTPLRVRVQPSEIGLWNPVGIASPQTLEARQDEAIGLALETLVKSWKSANSQEFQGKR